MAVTLKDLSRESGVNLCTVSRAMNGGRGVNEKTRARILSVAKRLGYRPNRVARGLATGRSHTVGLVISDIRNPVFADIARGAEDAAAAALHDLILCNTDLDPAKQSRYIEALLQKQVDGVIMNSVAGFSAERLAVLADSGVPVVLLHRAASTNSFSIVRPDNEAGGVLAAEHLLGLGHRRIAHLTGPKENLNLAERETGFRGVIANAPGAVELVVLRGRNNFLGGMELTQRLMKDHPEVTAIFAGNDSMAFGAARALLEAGRDIPGDVSLVGFDNVENASIMHPPLTTVHMPKYEMGAAAMEILLRLGSQKEMPLPENRTFGVSLVRRQSCGAPKR